METLKQTKELVDKILGLTQCLILTGKKENAETESDAYAALIEEREPLIEELTDLRLQIGETEVASDEFGEIKKIITQITDLDKKHMAIMEHLRKSVKESYKGVKQGQRIQAGYNPLPGDEVPSKFDVKH